MAPMPKMGEEAYMRTRLALAALTLATLSLTIPTASATNRADVEKIVGCIKAHTCKNLITVRDSYVIPSSTERIVFVSNGKRYTIDWSGETYFTGKPGNYAEHVLPREQWFLGVWVGPNATPDLDKADSFLDMGCDGSVDQGYGDHQNPRFFKSSRYKEWSRGKEFEQGWQQEYDDAIAIALKRLF
jgi:hypothetical protein